LKVGIVGQIDFKVVSDSVLDLRSLGLRPSARLDLFLESLVEDGDGRDLVSGMLDRNNLLDIIRTFTLFSTSDKGEVIKIVGRYQQFRAVKLAVKRLLEGKTPRERSGIIWHTQGSGKSLTMMFMVREMYRHPSLSKWKVVFITDRTQLENQLSETSQSIGFSVKVADKIKKLRVGGLLLAVQINDLPAKTIQLMEQRFLDVVDEHGIRLDERNAAREEILHQAGLDALLLGGQCFGLLD
jgi:hypothetical protein